MKRFSTCLLLGVLVALPGRGEQIFQSGTEKASLIELYTSEGCSSCPPAERWLSELRNDPRLWKTVVPVAFHVTYWDKLGWTDRFATKAFTERQYAYSHAWRSDSVYTPCFVRDGVEWKTREFGAPQAGGNESLWARITDDGHISVSFDSIALSSEAPLVWVALTVSEVESAVKSGENSGRTLRHDFTAVQLVTAKLVRSGKTGAFAASLMLPQVTETVFNKRALAVWVTGSAVPGPVLQAVGGWLNR